MLLNNTTLYLSKSSEIVSDINLFIITWKHACMHGLTTENVAESQLNCEHTSPVPLGGSMGQGWSWSRFHGLVLTPCLHGDQIEVPILEIGCPFNLYMEQALLDKLAKYQPLVTHARGLGYDCRIMVLKCGSLGHLHRLVAAWGAGKI